MKTHIVLALLALVISACASKENQGQSRFKEQQRQQDEYTLNHFDAGARFR